MADPDAEVSVGGIADIRYLLDRLDELVSSAAHLPFSSRVIVDEQEYLDIVDQLRLSLPQELKLARRVIAERDQILAEAQRRAEQLLGRAEEQIAQRVDEHHLVQAAEQRVNSLLDAAHNEAGETRRQADEYAYRVLSSLQNRVRRIQAAVEEGLAELDGIRRPDNRTH
jgi:glycyl-tRNA synthetase beta subunit